MNSVGSSLSPAPRLCVTSTVRLSSSFSGTMFAASLPSMALPPRSPSIAATSASAATSANVCALSLRFTNVSASSDIFRFAGTPPDLDKSASICVLNAAASMRSVMRSLSCSVGLSNAACSRSASRRLITSSVLATPPSPVPPRSTPSILNTSESDAFSPKSTAYLLSISAINSRS